MRKIRTTINLNETIAKKAKELGLNISALAEEKLIERIKEIESLEQAYRSKLNNLQGKSDNQNTNNEIKSNSHSLSMDWAGFEPAASTLRRWRSSELIYQPLKQKM